MCSLTKIFRRNMTTVGVFIFYFTVFLYLMYTFVFVLAGACFSLSDNPKYDRCYLCVKLSCRGQWTRLVQLFFQLSVLFPYSLQHVLWWLSWKQYHMTHIWLFTKYVWIWGNSYIECGSNTLKMILLVSVWNRCYK